MLASRFHSQTPYINETKSLVFWLLIADLNQRFNRGAIALDLTSMLGTEVRLTERRYLTNHVGAA